MIVEVAEHGAVLIVSVTGPRLDAAAAVGFKDSVRAVVRETRAVRVVLDLERVQFLDSSGLGAVIGLKQELAPERRLELAALGPAVRKVFRLTCMERIFAIHADAAAALSVAEDGPTHAC
ncbi:anti-sigma B factor antagonist [Tranquillimonas rosea]|uniref:Anti-sigma factor antagonist n=1 Tax=Tranquillimonas rosea TaxID=641238 RepID=A0A1H9W698_9RHOB|nr:STAS domain-containing protein [Tranquillimonas rosea]SES29385.1 anti-sigma B factor antagonist [Tranquillimonas rosea]